MEFLRIVPGVCLWLGFALSSGAGTQTLFPAGTPMGGQNNYTWNRMTTINVPSGQIVPFVAYSFNTLSAGGSVTYTCSMTTVGFAGAINIYGPSFDPTQPNVNFWQNGVVAGGAGTVTHVVNIPQGQFFEVVFSAANAGSAGTFSASISGPGAGVTLSQPTNLSIAVGPASQTILSGASAGLSVYAKGNLPHTWQWFLGPNSNTNQPVAGATNSTFTTPTLLSTTQYWVRVKQMAAPLATNKSGTATITVTGSANADYAGTLSPGGCTLQNGNLYVTQGFHIQQAGNYTFTVSPGFTLTTYQGSFDPLFPLVNAWGSVNGAYPVGDFVLVISKASPGGAFTGQIGGGPAIVTLHASAPPAFISSPQDKTILTNTSATLSASMTCGTPFTLQWYQGFSGDTNAPIGGATSSSYTTPLLQSNTTYWLRMTYAGGTNDSGAATVYVVTGSVTANGVISGCERTFNRPATASTLSGLQCFYKTFVFTPPVDGTYTISASSGSFGMCSDLYDGLFIPANPLVNLMASSNNSGGITAHLLGGTRKVFVTTTLSAGQTGPYSVTVTAGPGLVTKVPPPVFDAQSSATNIFRGQSVPLFVRSSTPNISYQWSQGLRCDMRSDLGGATSSNYTTAALTDYPGSYWCEATTPGGEQLSAAILVRIMPQAVDDSNTCFVGGATAGSGTNGVLANDIKADSRSLAAALFTYPTNGSISLLPDGGYTYQSTNGFEGRDSFTYRANDTTLDSAPGTVFITLVQPPSVTSAWKGTISSSWLQAANWEPVAVPGANDVVVFSNALSSIGDTSLAGAGWTVRTVRVTDPTNAISIGGPGVLKLGAGGVDMAAATVDVTLSNSANVELIAPQSWTVATGRLLTIGASITNGANALTLGGGGNVQLDGIISGAGQLVKDGPGTLTINSRNTFENDFIVSNGLVNVAVGSWYQGPVLGTSNVVIRPGARLDVTGYHPFGYANAEVNPAIIVDGGTLAYGGDAYTYALDLTNGAQVIYRDRVARGVPMRGRIDSRASAAPNVVDITPALYAGDIILSASLASGYADLLLARGLYGPGGIILTNAGVIQIGSASAHGFSRVSSGYLLGVAGDSFGTGRILMDGGDLYAAWPPGLWEGSLPGSFNTTDPAPQTSANLHTLRADMNDGFADDTTWVYSGLFSWGGGTVTFAEHFDESVLLKIDGTNVLNDTSLSTPSMATLSLASGLHAFELRLGQGVGGVGPVSPWTVGVGIDRLGRNQLSPTNFLPLVDVGNGSTFIRTTGLNIVSNRLEVIRPSAINGYYNTLPLRFAGLLDGGTSRVNLGVGTIQLGGPTGMTQTRANLAVNTPVSLGNTFFAGQIVSGGGAVNVLPGAQPAFAGEGSFPLGRLALTGGVLRVVHGRAFATNTVSLSGACIAFDTAGLDEGPVAGEFNLTSGNPGTYVRLEPVRAQSVEPSLFGDFTTWVYSGLLNITNPAGVTWTFAEDFDDSVQLVVDGQTNLYDTVWYQASKTNLILAAGIHTFELRLGNIGGGVSSPNGWPTGFGVDKLGRDELAATNFVSPLDPGDGSLWRRASVTFTNGFRAAADSSFLFQGPGAVNLAGPLDVSASTLVITSLVDSFISGTITGLGTLVKTGPGTLSVSNQHTGYGSLRIAQGTCSYPATSLPYELGKFTNIEIAAGARLFLGPGSAPDLAANQTLRGNGSIEGNVGMYLDGTVAPGVDGPGVITFGTGSAGVGLRGLVQMEIGGTLAGTGYDRLEVAGNVYVYGGTLTASLINGFTPIVGDSFTLFNASGGIIYSAPTFTAVNLPPLGAGMGWRVDYNPANISLIVTGAPPTGFPAYVQQIATPQRGIGDDPEGDGYANLLEYVTGGNPTNGGGQAQMSAVIQSNGILTIVFNQNAAAVDATLYVDATFSPANDTTWTAVNICSNGIWQAPSRVNQSGVYPSFITTVRDAIPAATNRVMRLRVTRP
jgi:autotransporter-associated beta strand protein